MRDPPRRDWPGFNERFDAAGLEFQGDREELERRAREEPMDPADAVHGQSGKSESAPLDLALFDRILGERWPGPRDLPLAPGCSTPIEEARRVLDLAQGFRALTNAPKESCLHAATAVFQAFVITDLDRQLTGLSRRSVRRELVSAAGYLSTGRVRKNTRLHLSCDACRLLDAVIRLRLPTKHPSAQEVVDVALTLAEQLAPDKGRPPDWTGLCFIATVARIAEASLGVRPSPSHKSVFRRLLSLVEEAVKQDPGDQLRELLDSDNEGSFKVACALQMLKLDAFPSGVATPNLNWLTSLFEN